MIVARQHQKRPWIGIRQQVTTEETIGKVKGITINAEAVEIHLRVLWQHHPSSQPAILPLITPRQLQAAPSSQNEFDVRLTQVQL